MQRKEHDGPYQVIHGQRQRINWCLVALAEHNATLMSYIWFMYVLSELALYFSMSLMTEISWCCDFRFYGYKKAFETTFRTLIDLPKFNGTVILRTISPTHFEPEYWEGRGYCVRRKPFSKQQVRYDWFLQMYKKIQMEEFLAAKREGEERGLKFRLLDITEVMLLRPDGHPNHYGHPPGLKNKLSDCLHWCLPGPIDVWNEFLLQMLKNENGGSGEGL